MAPGDPEEATCQDTGKWSSGKTSATCVVKECEPKISGVNMNNYYVSCSEDNRFGSSCKFACEQGYRINGDANGRTVTNMECTASSYVNDPKMHHAPPVWVDQNTQIEYPTDTFYDDLKHLCIRVKCPKLEDIPGRMETHCTEENYYGSECLIKCKVGVLTPSTNNYLTCSGSKGTWFDQASQAVDVLPYCV